MLAGKLLPFKDVRREVLHIMVKQIDLRMHNLAKTGHELLPQVVADMIKHKETMFELTWKQLKKVGINLLLSSIVPG